MKEIWRDIKDYEGHYQVSNWGRVKSIKFGKEKILKLIKDKDGYLQVTLCKNNIKKVYKVHRLVAEAFIDNTDKLPQVNHKDENKLNNNVENLEWCDRLYNVRYGTGIERRSKKRSKPVLQYDLEGNFIKEWVSINECGRNGYCQVHVSECCRGKRKYHKDCIWRYKNEEDN